MSDSIIRLPITLPAYAKINLFLHITGERPDGYHNLQTLFQFVDLKDTMTFSKSSSGNTSISSNIPISTLEDNLVYKATQALFPHAKTPSGMHIYIEKNIPMGAGLGGGSSNAATTLMAINEIWQCEQSLDQLKLIGAELGADIPIFIHGQCAWAEGIGEQLQSVHYPEQHILLVFPKLHIKTSELFKDPDLKKNAEAISFNDYTFASTSNVFEDIIRKKHPIIDQTIMLLSDHFPTRLTGTGACVYCLSDDKKALLDLQKKIDKELDTLVTKTVNFAAVNQMMTNNN